ncbi:MAG: hypothetical protein FH748_13455 [Balneolaceae bacterium]|nr:hypothetical protein [Balneolaceae bacterium]
MLFPKEIIEQTTHSLAVRHTIRSQVLYTLTICFMVGIFAMLPFIKVDVSVKSGGIIRSATERQVLKVPVTGIVSDYTIHENKTVQKGELLVAMEAEDVEQSIRYNQQKQEAIREYIWDLRSIKRRLVDDIAISLNTPLYRSEWLAFEQERTDLIAMVRNTESEYLRQKQLYEKDLVSSQVCNVGIKLYLKRNCYDFLPCHSYRPRTLPA